MFMFDVSQKRTKESEREREKKDVGGWSDGVASNSCRFSAAVALILHAPGACSIENKCAAAGGCGF